MEVINRDKLISSDDSRHLYMPLKSDLLLYTSPFCVVMILAHSGILQLLSIVIHIATIVRLK